LHAACAQGHIEVAEALVVTYKALTNVLNEQGTSPIFHAVAAGKRSIAIMILDNGNIFPVLEVTIKAGILIIPSKVAGNLSTCQHTTPLKSSQDFWWIMVLKLMQFVKISRIIPHCTFLFRQKNLHWD
jgi:hypothetical protein